MPPALETFIFSLPMWIKGENEAQRQTSCSRGTVKPQRREIKTWETTEAWIRGAGVHGSQEAPWWHIDFYLCLYSTPHTHPPLPHPPPPTTVKKSIFIFLPRTFRNFTTRYFSRHFFLKGRGAVLGNIALKRRERNAILWSKSSGTTWKICASGPLY